jgi:hypothetical protein
MVVKLFHFFRVVCLGKDLKINSRTILIFPFSPRECFSYW